jgi:hypothetical protein
MLTIPRELSIAPAKLLILVSKIFPSIALISGVVRILAPGEGYDNGRHWQKLITLKNRDYLPIFLLSNLKFGELRKLISI